MTEPPPHGSVQNRIFLRQELGFVNKKENFGFGFHNGTVNEAVELLEYRRHTGLMFAQGKRTDKQADDSPSSKKFVVGA